LYSNKFEFQSPLHGTYLRDVLQNRSKAMRIALEQDVRRVLEQQPDESAYLVSMISKYSIAVPQLDFDPDDIKKTEDYEQVHGTQLVGEVFIPDRLYRVWVVTFGIPFTGDIDLLQYVPRSGSGLLYPDVFISGQHLCFKARTLDRPEKDVQKIKAEKDKTIAFIQERLVAITPELKEYNQGLARDVPALFESLKQKYQKDKDALAQL